MGLKDETASRLHALIRDPVARSTAAYYLQFICLGLNFGIVGPTLPALARQSHAHLEQMGLLFLASSTGYTLGTLAAGRLYDRVRGHPLLGLSELGSALALFLIPIAPTFPLLLAVFVCRGFADGLVNTGANTLLIWTHGERVGPFMNALHFFFGLGAFLAPMLLAQLLGHGISYRWAYRALSAAAGLVAIRMLCLGSGPLPPRHRANSGEDVGPGRIWWPLVVSAALFLFFYVGAEVAFAGWIYTYAVALKLTTPVLAAYVTSLFWFSFTLGRLISIPAAIRWNPRQLIPILLVACLAAVALIGLMPGSRAALWAATAALGFCMAPIWPMGFTLAGQSVRFTARVGGMILLGDSLGGMILPWVVGPVIGAAGPRALVYLVFASLALNLLFFAAMIRQAACALLSARRDC